MWFRTQKKGAIFRPALVFLSVATIAFPPNVFADAVTFQWNGSSDNNFSNANNWTCDPTCATSPDNTAAGAAVDAIINSGQPDNVLLDTPSVITSLGLGGISPTSTLTTNGPSLTLGTPADYRGNVLAISGGGTLNINNGANVTLDMSGRDGFNASGAFIDSGGSISVTSATLTLQNSVNDGNAAVVTNNGSINLDAASSLTLGADAQIMVDGWGTLNLSGGTVGGSGSATLTNGQNHALVGSGQIQANFNNLGLLEASGGNLSVLSSAQVNTDIDTGTFSLTQGTYVVDAGAQLQFTQLGSNSLQSIEYNADVTTNGTGAITNGAGANALTGLASVNGNLLLDQNASLTLDQSQPAFEVGGGGRLTVDNGSILDTSARTFSNLNDQGVLTHGTFGVGDGAQLKYSSSQDITAIGEAAELDLAGSGQVVNTSGTAHDAVSNSLTTVDGYLVLNPFYDQAHAATLTLANPLTNHGEVDVNVGSTLTTQGFLNYADEFSSSCGCGASFQLAGGTAQINGDLTNHAAIAESDGFGEPSVEIGIDQGGSVNVTGNVLNSATSANPATSGSSAYMWLDHGSSLTVGGNLTNDSHGMGGFGYSPAELDLDGGSTVTVTQQVSNLGGSAILLDYNSGSGSTLNAGGLVNNNSFIFLVNGSALNVGQPAPTAAQPDQPTWAAQNIAADDAGPSGYAPNISLLQVGYPQDLFGPPDQYEQFTPAASVMNVTGGLLNQATSSNEGYSVSQLDVDSGSTLNADRVLNLSTVTQGSGSAEAEINVVNGSFMNVTTSDHTGVLTNSANPGTGFAFADVTVSGGSTLVADSVVNQFFSSPNGVGGATISVDASTMTVNNTFDNLGGVLNLTNAATVTVNGQFTNDAHGAVSLDGDQGVPSLRGADGLTGSVLNTNGFSNSGQVNLLQESTINNTGAFQNSGTVTIDNHSALNVTPHDGAADGSLTNTGTIATGASAGGGNTILVQGDAFNTAPGVINIHGEDDTMTVTGQFSNSGSVSIGNGATIQAESYTQTGGTTDIGQGGTLQANVYVTGGTVSGDGTIVGNVTVDGGTLAPGDPQSIDIIGDYHQTLLGILDVDLAGLGDGEYDQVNVMSDDQHPNAGNVWLGGTLAITLEDGFGAGINIGDVFHILTWTGERWFDSDFDFFRNAEFWNGTQSLMFREVLVNGGVDLAVVATPEPSTLAMLFGVMLLAGGAVWTRRRRNGLT